MRDLTGNVAVVYVAQTHDTEETAYTNAVGIKSAPENL